MAKFPTFDSIIAAFASASKLNANFSSIITSFTNTISRDGSTPNEMSADFDLNSNDVLNGGTLNAANLVVAGTNLNSKVAEAATSATNAATSETNAATSASAASTSATASAGSATASAASATLAAQDITRNEIATTNIDASIDLLRTSGFATVGDGGDAFYKRVIVEPTHNLKVTSLDGAFWEFVGTDIIAEQAGMKGDGFSASAAGNSTGIADAIAYLVSLGGGKLLMGVGRYKLNAATIITNSGIEIIGRNRQVTILDYVDAVSTNGIEVTGPVNYFRLEGLNIQNADNNGVNITSLAGNPSRCEIRNVDSKFHGGDGFNFKDVFLIEIAGILAQSNTGTGINFTGFHTTINAEQSQALSNSAGGWKVSGVAYSTFNSCASDQNTGHGWDFEQAYCSVHGSGAEANTLSGFKVVGNVGPTLTGVRAAFIGCFGLNNDSGGVGGNFLNIDATVSETNVIVVACSDKTAGGGRSNLVTGTAAKTAFHASTWVGSNSIAGDRYDTIDGNLNITKTTPSMIFKSGADTSKILLSAGDLFLQSPTGKGIKFSEIFSADISSFQVRTGGTFKDILHTDNGVAKTGATMTGLLTLSGAPTVNLHAATKLYVDTVTGGSILVTKTADETVNNSTTLQDDDHLLFAMAANTTYVVDTILLLTGLSGTPDFKIGWTVPAACTMFWEAINSSLWGTPSGTAALLTESGTDINNSVVGTNGVAYRAIVRNGANAGNLQLQWAQNAATAEDIKVLKHSHLIIREIGAT